MSSVKLAGVTKEFPPSGATGGPVRALDGIDVEIGSGERLGIIGRNGAGKTTLLQIMAGLTDPTSGTVDVDGHVTAVMTLGVGLRDQVSGRENIYLDGQLQGKTREQVDRVIDEVIAFAELGDFIDQPVRTYSTGMKARLAFSMLCHIEPDILIVDEALSVGDAAFSRKATAKIREITSRGNVVILVSHSMSAIADICTRCIRLENGRVVDAGSPADVTARYLDSVRRADDRAALARFSRQEGEWSHRHRWSVRTDLMQFGVSKRLVETGLPLTLAIHGTIPEPVGCEVSVAIARLDGARLFSHRFDATAHVDADGRLTAGIRFDPLVLGAAIYRVDVAAYLHAQPVAGSSTVFEIYSNVPYAGGKPRFEYPVTIEVVPTP